MKYVLLIVAQFALLTGCTNGPEPMAAVGVQAYQTLEETSTNATGGYILGPLDELAINVFYEPELSFERVVVDSGGRIPYPFLGSIQVEGKTTEEIARIIERSLDGRYVVNPQVSIFLLESASQRIAVEGEVQKPGVYDIKGRSSLLQALALAGGPQRTADLDEIIVFRRKPDGVYAARFDLAQIRAGAQPDPVLEGGDQIVVGVNGAGRFYRDILQVAPLLTVVFFRL